MKENSYYIILAIIIAVLIFIPTGFQKSIYHNAENVKAEILEVNDISVYQVGNFKQGEQYAKVRLLSGIHKGEIIEAVNLLSGQMATDKLYKVGEKVLCLVEMNDEDEIIATNTVDHYRIDKEIILVVIFALSLIVFAGKVGVKTVISFVFTLLCLIKLLVPLTLKGYDPFLTALIVGLLISSSTIFLISGYNHRTLCAIGGTMLSGFFTLILSLVFTKWMNLDGSTLPWVESLLYAGFQHLDLQKIFQSAIYLSALGAVVDLSVDISSALWEIKETNPEVSQMSLFKSGMNIGRTVVGSQATTLLLAYMGSYLTVIMVYMAQGTPVLNILTTKAIASEIATTFVGMTGLITVPPFTAMIAGRKFGKHNEDS